MAWYKSKILWFVVVALTLPGIAVLGLRLRTGTPEPAPNFPTPKPPGNVSAIGCLGRIEADDGTHRVGARSISGQPSIVGELKVKEGDYVKAGQLLAVLDSRNQLEAALRYSEASIQVARSRLAQVRAGSKPSDLEAQKAEIARIEAELAIAREDLRRAEQLRARDVASVAVVDQNRRVVESGVQLLNQARARLQSLAEVRQVDVDLAAAEVEAAAANAARAKAELEQTLIHSPVNGRVLEIRAWPREEVGPGGILEIAKTDRMYVIAEVVESDIRRVAVGQRAVVSGDALPAELHGSVELIRPKIAKGSMLNLNPSAFSDTRVGEVKIRLDESKVAAGFINAQVTVVIKP